MHEMKYLFVCLNHLSDGLCVVFAVIAVFWINIEEKNNFTIALLLLIIMLILIAILSLFLSVSNYSIIR